VTTLLAFAAAAAAQSGWTSSVVWDAPAATPVHAVALAVDPATGDRMFVLDVGQTARPYRPSLRYVRWDGAAYGVPVVLSRGLWTTREPFMPAVAVVEDLDALVVLSRAHQGTRAVGTRTQVVDRQTGAVLLESDALTLDPTVSQGRAAVASDGAEVHACVTAYTPGGDDVFVDHTAALAWLLPGQGDHLVARAGTQDHCGLAVRPDGTRVIAHHDGDGIEVLLEDAPGTLAPGFPLRLQPPAGATYNHPAVAVRATPAGDELHAVFVQEDAVGSTVLHATCVVDAATRCDDPADWSAPVPVVTQATPTHPQLRVDEAGAAYVAYTTGAAGARAVAVASRCPGAPAFDDTGVVDAVGEQGFGVDTAGTVENHVFLTPTSLAVDDAAGTLHLAWVRRDGGRSVAVEGWRDLATCP
jgi:hypothetical protein